MTCPRPHGYHKETELESTRLPSCKCHPNIDLALISGQTNFKPKGKERRPVDSALSLPESQRGWNLQSGGQRVEGAGAAQVFGNHGSHQVAIRCSRKSKAFGIRNIYSASHKLCDSEQISQPLGPSLPYL